MNSFCREITTRQRTESNDAGSEIQRQYQADALRLLSRVSKGGVECKQLQIRCGGTPCLHPEIMAIRERDITKFRNRPDFDLVFFTFATGQKPGVEMIECFHYCRMLLKPGGTLALLLPDDKIRAGNFFFQAFTQAVPAKDARPDKIIEILLQLFHDGWINRIDSILNLISRELIYRIN